MDALNNKGVHVLVEVVENQYTVGHQEHVI